MSSTRRRMLMQAGGSPTPTLPYIQNGLIGWWDGLWNVGIEQHDNNSNIWVDLSGNNRDGTLSGNCTWNNDNLNITGVWNQPTTYGQVEFDASNLPNTEYTWEICFLWKSYSPSFIGGANIKMLKIYDSGRIYYVRNLSTYINDLSIPHTIAISTDTNGNNNNIYVDGVLFDVVWTNSLTPTSNAFLTSDANTSNRYLGNPNADHYCYRTYNRALTDSELLSNHLKDKERFNF